MRKNLFLTLALIVASIATVNAQWSKVLSTVDGLPGVTDKAINCMVAETGLITPDAPIKGLRFTVIETRNMEKPDGHPCTAIAEFVIRDAEGNALNYMATGNSFIEESTGWPALNDGLYNGYMHTNWSGGNPTGAHHYIEFTFDEPVSAFSLEWANRQGNPKNAPTLVVLTEKGVDGEAVELPEIPASTYTLGSQIASLDELLAADYVSMEAETFKGDFSKDVTGWLGARFFTAPNALVISDSTQNYNARMAMQVVPTGDDDDTYYLLWHETGRYFGRNNLTSTLNQNAGCKFIENGEGATTTADAAKLTINDNGDGTFTMSFITPEGDLAYLCADPRTDKGIKSVNELFKAQNEAKDYVAGFGYPCVFNFKFYTAEYEKASHLIVNSLREPVADTKYLSELFGGAQACEPNFPYATTHAEMMANVEAAEAIIAGGTTTAAEAAALIAKLQTNQIWYLYTVVYQKILEAYAYQAELDAAGLFCYAESPITDCYTYESWNNGPGAVLQALMNDGAIYKVANEGPLYTFYNELINSLGTLEQAITVFKSGKISFQTLPLFYGEKDGLPGTVGSLDTRTWTSPSIRFQEPINSFRITFARSANPAGGVVGAKDKAIVLGELIIMDAEGNRIAMSGDMVVTNAIEPSEGSLAGLFDGQFDASGNLTREIGSFYHSPWTDANGWDAESYIYFDITLPQPMDGIKLAFHSRQGSNKSYNPADICVGAYGEEYDPIAASPNTYNARIGEQVTSIEDITDWGVYAIRGLINTNPNPDAVAEPIEPMWYAGEQPFHKSVVREDCAYFFTKNEDGTVKIMSIGEAKYWTAGGGLTSYSNEAANIHIVPSTNADFEGQNTLVLYTDVENPEPQGAKLEYVDAESELEIIVDSVGVTCPYRVLMDWGAGVGLAARVCIDYQPGVNPANYGDQAQSVEVLLEHPNLVADSNAGDNLHFNKTSGEGEWKIYKLSLDNPYYYWATSLATVAEGLGFVAGNNPGEYADLGKFATDLAAVQAVVENNDYAGAEDAAKTLAATLEAMSGGEYTQNPVTEGVYAILCDARGDHALTIDDNDVFVGTAVPANFTSDLGKAYLFQLEVPANLDELLADETITEEQKDKVFAIKHLKTGYYIVGGDGTSQPISLADYRDGAGAFLFTGGATNYFTIGKVNNYEGYNQLHLAGGLKMVSWNGEPQASSASGFRLVRVADDATSVEDLVVEGSEVVSVKYYTVGGAESAAPVKGMNVVTIVYSNGVTETKKVVVE